MKTDYLFLNRILTGISEKQSHIVDVLELSEEVKQPHLAIGNNEYLDKFYGHLQLLKDAGAIVELCGRDLGVHYLNDGKFNCSDCQIRLTAAGYDADNKDNFEIVHFHWAKNKQRRTLEKKAERIKEKS